jgi:hypothetical protein
MDEMIVSEMGEYVFMKTFNQYWVSYVKLEPSEGTVDFSFQGDRERRTVEVE